MSQVTMMEVGDITVVVGDLVGAEGLKHCIKYKVGRHVFIYHLL